MLWDIASRCRALVKAAFMVQKEVGLRLAASPCSKDYGALSVWTQAFWTPRMAFTVGPGAFNPPPKVDSAVLSFVPKTADLLPKRPEALASLVKLCFQQRRKQIGGLFRKGGRPDLLARLEELNISLQARPEELTVEQFMALSGN
ncbi:MAG: rRNA adenine N-6-methyltransferase family protein, partial [Desulfovibrionaceae bacterium]|nr:rRNA adenine N-6-methyltransferase family protein [Desulfovibrionaceae bacterium]